MFSKTDKIIITDIMNKFPEVKWDRYTYSRDRITGLDNFWTFGWIAREDGKFDFAILEFSLERRFESISTSSAEYSEEFAKRLGQGHNKCRRVEDLSLEVKSAKLNEPKRIIEIQGMKFTLEDDDQFHKDNVGLWMVDNGIICGCKQCKRDNHCPCYLHMDDGQVLKGVKNA